MRSTWSRQPEVSCSPIKVQREYAHFDRAQHPQVIEKKEKKNVDVTVHVDKQAQEKHDSR